MESKIQVVLKEEDVQKAIKDYVQKHKNLSVNTIQMQTGVRGDYDKGNAEKYVKKVWCECEQSDDLKEKK